MDDQKKLSGNAGRSGTSGENKQLSDMESELYLLIAKFLSTGVCQKAAEVLKNEIQEHHLLPKRVDWLGEKHDRNIGEIEHVLSQVSDDHLLKICCQIGPILDKEIPPTVPGLQSLIGVGRQSLLRTREDLSKAKVSNDYLIARKNGVPFFPSPNMQTAYPPNITKVLLSRELSGSIPCRHIFSTKQYARLQPLRRFLGHLSSVYCVLFDRTGKYIFTGADDLLVKIWSSTDGRLLASLRGHSAEITDMTVNYENTLLAAGSCDKTIRVWCVRTTVPVAVLCAHTAMVTSIQFCPYPKGDANYLVSTGNDGCICFWQWSLKKKNSYNFSTKPVKFTERNRAGAQMICSSFSEGGVLLATGSTDHNVRVYNMAGPLGPEKILEKEIHTDRVDSIQFSNLDCRFISGSKDGTAQIWKYEKQNWHCVSLKMTTKLSGSQPEEVEDVKLKLRVTMVGWTLDDGMVITAVSDHSMKVWDSFKGSLCHILKGHEDEVFVLECHPLDPRVLLSSGHDGRINLWDLNTGTVIKSHFNLIEGQGHGAVFDCKFSPDGHMFAATDSHGHLIIFGLGSTDRFKKIPEEQFFHTDYRPLIRDINHHVLDEQTQTPPHLLPPPFLVDIDGNPYPPNLQRLVPGREHCNESQLIPYVTVSAEGEAEILEPVRPPEGMDRPTIDDMIERLQQEQEQHVPSPSRNPEPESSDQVFSPRSGQRSPRVSTNERNGLDSYSPRSAQRSQSGHSRVGMRRTGDIEGVRQSVGNWQTRGTQIEVPSWVKKVVVKPMPSTLASSHFQRRLVLAEKELTFYNAEKRKRSLNEANENASRKTNDRRHGQQHLKFSQRTRANRSTRGNTTFYEEFETDFPGDGHSSSSSETEPEQNNLFEESSGREESGSGDDSDWIADGGNASRGKMPARAPKPSTSGVGGTTSRPRRYIFSDGGGDDDDDQETEEEEEEAREEDEESDQASVKRSSRSRKKIHPQREKHETRAQTAKKRPERKKLPERYRPPEWLTDVMPHKVPYVPQIGDEVVYFRQGHELYVQAVRRNRVYEIFMRNQPWRQLKKLNLRDQEVVRVVNISFENHVPRLCCLKLELLNPVDDEDKLFTLKYHDMADVVDFLVLKQYYDQGMQYNWKPGDRFRSAIDKAWWLGTVKGQKPYNENYLDSPFQCFIVKWDNGEKECMSPWDFEPIDPERMPSEVGGSVDITPDERQAMMYCPGRFEWSSFGQDYDIDRILRGLTKISELSIAEPFISPVDLVCYPSYAMHVAYPMDLGTIKARLQNRFYRRLDAVKFDLEYIKLNAIKFNEPGSRIVKQAKCVVELCLKFFDSVGCEDPMDFYNEMLEAKRSRSQDSQSELDVVCSESDRDTEYTTSTRLKRKKRRENMMPSSKRLKLESQKYTSESWKIQCSALLDETFQLDDSTPFRCPVSLMEYPDYRNIIDCPMDLSTAKEKLETNQYFSPIEFCKDMRLIFQNSRNFNTNKKSKIYSMTIRLSASFEEQIRSIVSDWKSAVKYEEKLQNNQFVSSRRQPFSTVGADANLSMLSSRPSDNSCRSEDNSQPGPSRRNHTAHLSKYKDSRRSRPKIKKRDEKSPSKLRSSKRKSRRHLRYKIGNSLTNGDMKNSRMKSRKIKREQKQNNNSSRRSIRREKVANNTETEEDSDKNTTENDASSPFDDDDNDHDYDERRPRKKETHVSFKGKVHQKLRPRRLHKELHRSNHNTRSSSQKLQESSMVPKHFSLESEFRNLRSRSSPPGSSGGVSTHPTVHRLTNALPQRSSRLSTLRNKRKATSQSIKSSADSDSNESKQNSSNSSKSENESSDDNGSISQHSHGSSAANNDHSDSKEHSESDYDEETSPENDHHMRRSTRATTRDSTKATCSALHEPKPKIRGKSLNPTIQTRNRGQRTVRYIEDSDDDEGYNFQNFSDENSTPTSFSRHGRLRKLIHYGKTLLSD